MLGVEFNLCVAEGCPHTPTFQESLESVQLLFLLELLELWGVTDD
jgi:hypothetical protein